jgi:hypothetical protein
MTPAGPAKTRSALEPITSPDPVFCMQQQNFFETPKFRRTSAKHLSSAASNSQFHLVLIWPALLSFSASTIDVVVASGRSSSLAFSRSRLSRRVNLIPECKQAPLILCHNFLNHLDILILILEILYLDTGEQQRAFRHTSGPVRRALVLARNRLRGS